MIEITRASVTAATLADIRTEIEADRPVETTRDYPCSDCGHIYRREIGDDRTYCPDCGMSRQLSAGDQMKYRQGPVYERAVRGQLRYWLGEAARLGLAPDVD